MADDAWSQLLSALDGANDHSKYNGFRMVPTNYKQLRAQSHISARILLPKRLAENTAPAPSLPLIVRIHVGYLVSQYRAYLHRLRIFSPADSGRRQ